MKEMLQILYTLILHQAKESGLSTCLSCINFEISKQKEKGKKIEEKVH